MIYVTIAVEDPADTRGLPGEVVTVSTENPYERGYVGGWTDWVYSFPIPGHNSDWIPHTGTECPVHPLDVVEVKYGDGEIDQIYPGKCWDWCYQYPANITYYRHVTDPDGIPYVYDKGDLPEWAEYVATDEDGDAYCYDVPPRRYRSWWGVGEEPKHSAQGTPKKYANTKVHWTQSLRRVWRESKG